MGMGGGVGGGWPSEGADVIEYVFFENNVRSTMEQWIHPR